MERTRLPVEFCREYSEGDLPSIYELVSDTPDDRKELILDYLSTNPAVFCPGIVYDLFDPAAVIGDGSIYRDDKYYWPDYLAAYVEKYNIRLPEEFRNHILKNNQARKESHLLLQKIDRILIQNNPYLGYHYKVSVSVNGLVEYENNTVNEGKAVLLISPSDAAWLINPIMTDLFCYDDGCDNARAMIDGYYWSIEFYISDELKKQVSGWPSENQWRLDEFSRIIHFAERIIPKDLGGKYMHDEASEK
ncbi:MAG: hypothetical protein K6F61_06555 [Clostridiales bacterium]|nr:hypothetical protein [Clostridiales bacterium]